MAPFLLCDSTLWQHGPFSVGWKQYRCPLAPDPGTLSCRKEHARDKQIKTWAKEENKGNTAKSFAQFDNESADSNFDISLETISAEVILPTLLWKAAVRMCKYRLSVGVMLPLMAVLSAAWIEVDPESCTNNVTMPQWRKSWLSFFFFFYKWKPQWGEYVLIPTRGINI